MNKSEYCLLLISIFKKIGSYYQKNNIHEKQLFRNYIFSFFDIITLGDKEIDEYLTVYIITDFYGFRNHGIKSKYCIITPDNIDYSKDIYKSLLYIEDKLINDNVNFSKQHQNLLVNYVHTYSAKHYY